MENWTIPVSEPSPKDSFEIQYYQVKSERDGLTQKLNDLDDANRVLRTKCAQLETFKKRVVNGADAGKVASSMVDTSGRPKDIHEIQNDYEHLFTAYSELQRDYRAAMAKHKSSMQVIGKLKKEIKSLKLRYVSRLNLKNNRTSFTSGRQSGGCRRRLLDLDEDLKIDEPSSNKENVENTLGQLQLRLSSAEEQLHTLRSNPPTGDAKVAAHEESNSKIHLLQAQHELDESRIQTQAEKLGKILSLHKEYKARHGALKKELCFYQEENEALEFRVAQLEDYKEQAEELTEQNRLLEDKVRGLCEVTPSKDDGYKRERRMLAREIEETQRARKLLAGENKRLREENKQLNSQLDSAQQYFARNRPHSSPPATSGRFGDHTASATTPSRLGDVWQQLDYTQRQCSQKEEELNHANRMLQSQIATNGALRTQLGDNERKLRRETGAKIEGLTFKAARRLQKIRWLESQLRPPDDDDAGRPTSDDVATPPTSSEGRNALEVKVHGAALEGLPGDARSFVLVDFYTYGSELSDLVRGARPAFDFAVTYEMEVDDFSAHALARGESIRAEIYALEEETGTPRLFAYASVSTSVMLNSPAGIHLPRLELVRAKGEGAVGSLSLSIRLARPMTGHGASLEMMGVLREGEREVASCQQQSVPDAISISIENAILSGNPTIRKDDSFFVHYQFLTFGDTMTNLEHVDGTGEVTFRHESSFPILPAENGSLEQVLAEISKGALHFTLFSGRKRSGLFNSSGNHESESYAFHVVGQAEVALSDIWGHAALSPEIVSLEGKVLGSMAIAFGTTVEPISHRTRQDVKKPARSNFMAMLTDVMTKLGDEDGGAIDAARLLRFMSPPAGILHTAKLLREQMNARFPGRTMSEAFAFSPNGEEGIGRSEFLRRSDDARSKVLFPCLPPVEELDDLYHYLSDDDGQVCVRDLNCFVASADQIKTQVTVRQELLRMKRTIREDLLSMGGGSGGVITIHDVKEYVDELFDNMSEEELTRLFPLICPALQFKKTHF